MIYNSKKIISVGLLSLLAGCSSLNPFASKPAPKNPPVPLAEFQPSLKVTTVWKSSVGPSKDYAFSPAFAANSIFAAAANGTVVRFDARSGQEAWRINLDAPLTAGVGSDGNTVAVAAGKGQVIALSGAGTLRWKAQAASEILSSPVVVQGLVIVRSLDNQVAAFDADSGARRWVVRRAAPSLILRSAPGLVATGNTVIVAMPGGKLLALDAASGASRWEATVGDPKGATELERIVDISGTPFIAGRDVCAVAFQGRIGCYDITTGAPRWMKDFSSNVGVGADERLVFAADQQSRLYAFSRMTGQSMWQSEKLLNRNLSAPASLGNAVAVGDYQGYVHFLSHDDGSVVGRSNIDPSPIRSTPINIGSSVIFQTVSGTLAALAAE